MKHFPKSLLSFRKLQGGQFGTLDVSAISPDYIQLALGTDFVQLTRPQWIALRSVGDRFFRAETERVILTRDDGEPVLFEEMDADDVEAEEIVDRMPPRGARPPRPRPGVRRRDSMG
jgi:hypothetical protein